MIAPLGTTPFTLKPDQTVEAYVVVQNKNIGHSLIPEVRDLYEAWVQFTVKDASGAKIYESGFLKPDGMLDERAHSFTNRPVDMTGKLRRQPQSLDDPFHGLRQHHSGRTLGAGPLPVPYTGRVRRPADHHGARQLSPSAAELSEQCLGQGSSCVSGGRACLEHPHAEYRRQSRPRRRCPPTIRIGCAGTISASDTLTNCSTTTRCTPLSRSSACARTTRTATSISASLIIEWEKYAEARAPLEKALTLHPDDARALYYLALVERRQRHSEAEVADLEKVVAQYPYSRDARRELGISYYQQHRSDEAMEQFKALQAIDPDDVAAHYNLAILYRRMGMKQQAAQEAALYAIKRIDPAAPTYSLDYLRKHPEISTESVPWHMHTDSMPAAVAAARGGNA